MTRVVVAGALANKPANGGEAWVRLSWIRGLQDLGVDVWFVEETSSSAWAASDPDAPRRNAEWFRRVVESFGLTGRASLLDSDTGASLVGLTRSEVLDVASGSDLLANISGHLRQPLLGCFRRRAYVDIDPGYTQIWHLQGAPLGVEDHDVHFTVALNAGHDTCSIPDDGVMWIPLPPPVVLADWTEAEGDELDRFTTVGSWRGGFGPAEHAGVRYGIKAHEFRKFLDVPRLVPVPFELALAIDPGDEADRDALVDHGWRLVDPAVAAGDPESFRRYVQSSAAEFSVAQGVYVQTGSGWVSDRTVRYLACGRPALVQATGLPASIPAGEGLVMFSTVEDAVSRAAEIRHGYRRHRKAARRLAEEHFESSRVLGRLLEAGLG